MTEDDAVTRPIIGIENRTAQEVFDIMCGRFRAALSRPPVAAGAREGWKAANLLLAQIDYFIDAGEIDLDPAEDGAVVEEIRRDIIAAFNPAPVGEKVETALNDIAAERERQKAVEGWTEEHDDNHVRGEMALAAACYAAACYAVTDFPGEAAQIAAREVWPWEDKWWKPKDFRRNLVRAGALIVAEIERHDRIAAKRPSRSPANE